MSHADKLHLLADECANLRLASQHLRFSVERVRSLIPRLHTNLALDVLERLESLASRFARLADLLIQRVMRLVDDIELIASGSLIDRILRAEKRGWTDQAARLIRIRELRNLIAHEYAADKMADIYDAVFVLAPELENITQRTVEYAEKLINSLKETSK